MLDDSKKIRSVDKQDMLGKVFSFPDMLKAAISIAAGVNINFSGKIDSVVISGMGGSAICGDVAKGVLEKSLEVPILINRNYSLPAFIKGNVLFFSISYSGNTEETLAALEEAESRGLKIVAISSGGRLSDVAKRKGYPLISLPAGIQPRAALPYLLCSVLMVFQKAGLYPAASDELKKAIDLLYKLRDEYVKKSAQNPVKKLAKKLFGGMPILIASEGLTRAAGLRWMNQINENSKMMAHLTVVPEMGHNEIVGFAELKKAKKEFSAVFLRQKGGPEGINKRMKIAKSLLSDAVSGVNEVWAEGSGDLEKILSLILFGDFLSVYLALLGGVDPTPVEIIEKQKRELAK